MLGLNRISRMFSEMGLGSEAERAKFQELTKWSSSEGLIAPAIYIYDELTTNPDMDDDTHGKLE